jgi:branched-chain amino acid transport system permease protein
MLGWLDTVIQGVLLGGLYSLYATGLSVIFGIMRLVNLAHGDLIVLGAFLTLALTTLGVPIVAAVALVLPLRATRCNRYCSTERSAATSCRPC